MRRELPSWVWVVGAAIVGALLPGVFLSMDPHAHFPWMLAWLMISPVTAAIAVGLWWVGRLLFRKFS